MIKGIYPSGRYVQVNNGTPSWPPYNSNYQNSMTNNTAMSFAGQVRFNSQNGGMEIFDGYNWQQVSNSMAQVGLSQEAERILDWARKKMDEEHELKVRMEKHPGLKDAWERFKIMDALTIEEEKAGMEESAGVQASP